MLVGVRDLPREPSGWGGAPVCYNVGPNKRFEAQNLETLGSPGSFVVVRRHGSEVTRVWSPVAGFPQPRGGTVRVFSDFVDPATGLALLQAARSPDVTPWHADVGLAMMLDPEGRAEGICTADADLVRLDTAAREEKLLGRGLAAMTARPRRLVAACSPETLLKLYRREDANLGREDSPTLVATVSEGHLVFGDMLAAAALGPPVVPFLRRHAGRGPVRVPWAPIAGAVCLAFVERWRKWMQSQVTQSVHPDKYATTKSGGRFYDVLTGEKFGSAARWESPYDHFPVIFKGPHTTKLQVSRRKRGVVATSAVEVHTCAGAPVFPAAQSRLVRALDLAMTRPTRGVSGGPLVSELPACIGDTAKKQWRHNVRFWLGLFLSQSDGSQFDVFFEAIVKLGMPYQMGDGMAKAQERRDGIRGSAEALRSTRKRYTARLCETCTLERGPGACAANLAKSAKRPVLGADATVDDVVAVARRLVCGDVEDLVFEDDAPPKQTVPGGRRRLISYEESVGKAACKRSRSAPVPAAAASSPVPVAGRRRSTVDLESFF